MCPICGKPVRSDALTKKSCKLCGMLIDDSKPRYIHGTNSGKIHYFCCEKCRSSYLEITEDVEKERIQDQKENLAHAREN
jgi:YHS domain-containing protein